jgi:ABC-2 type transport system ATP-binding protein
MDAIKTTGLTKHYQVGFWRPRPYIALDNLSLSVATGEVFGFLGPNGAGKTTTLKLLMQLIYPTSGHAEILGSPVGDVAVKRRIGYLPENPYFYDNLTAEELLVYFARMFGCSAREGRERASRLLDDVGIGAERRFQLRKFSKGMVQRVGIAQALINDPELVFLDELTTGLDPQARRAIWDLVRGIRDRGKTVFLTTHLMEEAERLCDRIAILDHGRVIDIGTPAELVRRHCPERTIVVATEDSSAQERFRAIPAVESIGVQGQQFTIRGRGDELVTQVIQCLGEHRMPVVDFRTETPTLEDVFLTLTGHLIRD